METATDNRFTKAGFECVFFKDNIQLYRGKTYEDFLVGSFHTGWCNQDSREKFEEEYSGEYLYTIVKILPNGIKVVGGIDSGYAKITLPNNVDMPFEKMKEYFDAIDFVFTDEVISNIKPFCSFGGRKDHPIGDVPTLMKLSPRINKAILKNKTIMKIIAEQKMKEQNKQAQWFYDPYDFKCLLPIINNRDVIVEEMLSGYSNDNNLLRFVADFTGDNPHSQVDGDWLASQVYYRKSGNNKINPPTVSREIKRKWIQQLRHAKNSFPETQKLMTSVKEIYWSGVSKIAANSSIKTHQHIQKVPLLQFQICVWPSSGNCVLTVNNEPRQWKEQGQMVLFDGSFEHSLKNEAPDSRLIYSMDFDPSSHPDYKLNAGVK